MPFILFLMLVAAGQAAPAESAEGEAAISMELTRTAHGDAVVSLAELTTEANIPKEARRLYEKALKAERKGDRVRARGYALAAVELAPAFFQAHAAVAVAHLQAGELDAADRGSLPRDRQILSDTIIATTRRCSTGAISLRDGKNARPRQTLEEL